MNGEQFETEEQDDDVVVPRLTSLMRFAAVVLFLNWIAIAWFGGGIDAAILHPPACITDDHGNNITQLSRMEFIGVWLFPVWVFTGWFYVRLMAVNTGVWLAMFERLFRGQL